MSTTTISEQARRYLDEVRDGLIPVLPAEEAEEVLQDLEAHLAEIGADDIESTLGMPAEFLAEFRSSAGLDETGVSGNRWWRHSGSDVWRGLRDRLDNTFSPVFAPLARRSNEIKTAWIWSRGIFVLLAYSWLVDAGAYGEHSLLVPRNSNLWLQVPVMALATFASVRLGSAPRGWWKRIDSIASIGAGFLMLVAVTTTQYFDYPQESFYEYQGDAYLEQGGAPVLLIGPNGPIQNLFAYDVDGNPVQVLLYDEYGNPIQTLPSYAYEEAAQMDSRNPFIWEGFEVRFQEDTYGRPIGNLFPLERYEWTGNGARSAPQPPPVVGIPEVPATDEADAVPPEEELTTTTVPVATTTVPATTTTQVEEPATETTEPPATTTTAQVP